MGEGLVDANPVIGTNRSEEKSRDRVLSPDEFRLIWNALGSDHFAAIMKLLALTGQRAGEVAGMRWSEIDVEKAMWSLPSGRTKNHRPHTVPLSAAALAILTAQERRSGSDGKPRDLIFGMGEGPFSGWSNSKEALDESLTEAAGKELPHWTPHDLRRSFATHAAGIGIQPHIIEAVLNHVSGHRAGVAGIYNRATYEPEKRAALDRVGRASSGVGGGAHQQRRAAPAASMMRGAHLLAVSSLKQALARYQSPISEVSGNS